MNEARDCNGIPSLDTTSPCYDPQGANLPGHVKRRARVVVKALIFAVLLYLALSWLVSS